MTLADFSVDGDDDYLRVAAYQGSTSGGGKHGAFQRLELERHAQLRKEEEERRMQEEERSREMERDQGV